jgi:hypothetical protein
LREILYFCMDILHFALRPEVTSYKAQSIWIFTVSGPWQRWAGEKKNGTEAFAGEIIRRLKAFDLAG